MQMGEAIHAQLQCVSIGAERCGMRGGAIRGGQRRDRELRALPPALL